ncbi:MAG: nucleotide exchange factor GrpE [Bacillota bacterium]
MTDKNTEEKENINKVENGEVEEEKIKEDSSQLEKEEKQEEVEKEEELEKEEENDETAFADMERVDLIEYINSLEEEVASLEEEKDKYYNKLQRLQADFVNYRNRTKREKESIALESKIELVNEILPVIDNFERALSSEGEENDLRTGVEMIYKQLINNLKSQGLEKICTVGEEFDHKYHEAIMQVEDCEEDSGIIVEEMQKGYLIEDKVIRPAMVKVAK